MAYQKRNNNRSNNSNSSNKQTKKHSGASTGYTKEGAPYTTGWNYSRRHGLVSFGCFTYKGSKETVSARGVSWLNVHVVVSAGIGGKKSTSGLMDMQTGRVIVKDYGVVINPKAPNGGYCGKFGK